MDMLFVVAAWGATVMLACMLGSAITRSPSETEMFARLVQLRKERRFEADAKTELNAELNAAAGVQETCSPQSL